MKTGTVDEVLNLPVRDVMTTEDLRTVTSDMPVNDVAKEMLNRGIGAFPVMTGKKVNGIVTDYDLVRAFTENV
jgi:CBS domain-containing protein